MREALAFGLLSFSSLVTIIDPVGVAPLFVSMTREYDARARRLAALKACGVALTLLLIFAVGGGIIFTAFGVTLDALRIAGGILFFVMSMQMLTGSGHALQSHAESTGADPIVVPLAMPLICGPGAISTVMVLMGQSSTPFHVAYFLTALVLALVVTLLVLLVAPRILDFLGKTGVEVVTRVIGLIVCAIGIQFVIDGVRPVLVDILSHAR